MFAPCNTVTSPLVTVYVQICNVNPDPTRPDPTQYKYLPTIHSLRSVTRTAATDGWQK